MCVLIRKQTVLIYFLLLKKGECFSAVVENCVEQLLALKVKEPFLTSLACND